MKRFLLIICCTLSFLSKNYACSCEDLGPFFENRIIKAYGINCIAVLDSHSYTNNSEGLTSSSGYFTVLDTLGDIKTTIGSSILVQGQDGLNCGANVHALEVGDTFLLLLSDGFYEKLENDTFYLDGCGKFYLSTKDDAVSGLTVEELKQKMKDFITDTDELISQKSIKVFPNPVKDQLHFFSNDYPITQLRLFNINGQELLQLVGLKSNNLDIVVSDYPSGLYHIHISTEKGLLYKKFIKQ